MPVAEEDSVTFVKNALELARFALTMPKRKQLSEDQVSAERTSNRVVSPSRERLWKEAAFSPHGVAALRVKQKLKPSLWLNTARGVVLLSSHAGKAVARLLKRGLL